MNTLPLPHLLIGLGPLSQAAGVVRSSLWTYLLIFINKNKSSDPIIFYELRKKGPINFNENEFITYSILEHCKLNRNDLNIMDAA